MRSILFATCTVGLMAVAILRAQDPSYLRDVRPILDNHCTSCHQPASKQSDLDLTTFGGFETGGKRGPAFMAGSPEQSLVMQFVTAALKPSMPFGQPPLAATDVAKLRDWIAAGAKKRFDDRTRLERADCVPPTSGDHRVALLTRWKDARRQWQSRSSAASRRWERPGEAAVRQIRSHPVDRLFG
jgi:hypothetical protein